jgi:methyltransferase (TIGR00027 family)
VSEPDSTAVRTALWRARHVELDAEPHVLVDTIGLELADPPDDWRDRGDMHPQGTAPFRAAMVSRGRFVEDLVLGAGVEQYVLLGAGLDTFAQRRPDAAVTVYEVDQPGTQAWKRERLEALGYPLPRFVPVDFEAGDDWWDRLAAAGFDRSHPAVVASTGVSMYLTKEATAATLRQLAELAPGSTVAMTFLLPMELVDDADKPGLEMSSKGAAASGTPFVSFYRPDEIVAMALDAGFPEAHHVAGTDLGERWFADRTDGLRPSSGEDVLVATT